MRSPGSTSKRRASRSESSRAPSSPASSGDAGWSSSDGEWVVGEMLGTADDLARRRHPMARRHRPGRTRASAASVSRSNWSRPRSSASNDSTASSTRWSMRWFDHAREVAAGDDLPDGPFRGVPFLLKDLSAHYAGQPLTNGNVALREAHADLDRPTRRSCRGSAPPASSRSAAPTAPSSGSVPVTEPVAYGPTRNPWNIDRVARRIERRGGGGGRIRHGADRPRLRRRRLDPDPGLVLRAGRPQAVAGHGSRSDRTAPRAD